MLLVYQFIMHPTASRTCIACTLKLHYFIYLDEQTCLVVIFAATVCDYSLQLNRHSARFQIHRLATGLCCYDYQSHCGGVETGILHVAVQEREAACNHGSVESTQGWRGKVTKNSFKFHSYTLSRHQSFFTFFHSKCDLYASIPV